MEIINYGQLLDEPSGLSLLQLVEARRISTHKPFHEQGAIAE